VISISLAFYMRDGPRFQHAEATVTDSFLYKMNFTIFYFLRKKTIAWFLLYYNSPIDVYDCILAANQYTMVFRLLLEDVCNQGLV